MELPEFLQSLPDEFLIAGFFIFLLIYSFSLPITEEIALVCVGLMAHARDCNFFLVLLVAYPGIFGSDIVYYTVAKYFGFRLLSSRVFKKIVKPQKVYASERYFKRRGPRIAFFCRFVMGIRAPAMIAAGLLRMPFRIFVRYDGLSALISTLFWLSAGFYFGSLIERGLHTLLFVFSVLTPVLMISGVLLIRHKIACEEKRIELMEQSRHDSFSEPVVDTEAYGNI